MNVLSLFSGIGGLELGLERAGMTVVGQVEIDPFCHKVLAKHWPEVPRHDDVRTCVDWWRSEPRPTVDVVCGGFPCQPVSVAGLRLAQDDERWLWPAAWAVIRDLRPRYALLENVPGLLGRGMGDVLGDLAEIGYDAEWDCVPAAAVGAPHRRDQVFLVTYPGGDVGGVQPVAQSRSGGAPVVGFHGQAGGVADAARDGRGTGWPRRSASGGAYGSPVAPPRLAWTRSDAVGQGRRARRAVAGGEGAASGEHQDGLEPSGGAWWAAEPDVGRVAYGVPGKVDRLRGLGNAVVPQVAEYVGRLIVAADRGVAA